MTALPMRRLRRRRGPYHVPKHAAAGARGLRAVTPLLVVIALALTVSSASAGVAYASKDTALPGVSVAGLDVAGMSREEVVAAVEDRVAATTVSITVAGSTTEVPVAEAGARVDATAVADAVMEGSGSVVDGALSLVKNRDVPVTASIDEAAVVALAHRLDSQVGSVAVDASIQVTADGSGFEAVDGAPGTGVDRTELTHAIQEAATTLEPSAVELSVGRTSPDVTLAEAQAAAEAATGLMTPEVSVVAAGETITADAATRASWVETTVTDGTLVPTLSRQSVAQWVDEVAGSIERAPVSAVENVDASGTVLEPARPAKTGLSVTDREAQTDAILAALEAQETYAGELTTEEIPAGTEQRVVPAGPERFAYSAQPGEKWVDVNLTDSTLTAYEGYTQVYGPILVNHGGVGHETVLGTYRVYLKYEAQDMGCTPDWPYCHRAVPWVAYWYQSYALHGAPWVQEFGIGTDETSHGCINIPVEDAHWIHDWVEIGTAVVTHE